MINSCKRRKILVCAPSNAAIDEIVFRIVKNTFSTQTRDAVLRVGAMDYEPREEVKKHTLDYKLEQEIQKLQYDREGYHNEQPGSNAGSNNGSPIYIKATLTSPNQQAELNVLKTGNDLSKAERTKALETINKAQKLLRFKEHTPDSLTQLI